MYINNMKQYVATIISSTTIVNSFFLYIFGLLYYQKINNYDHSVYPFITPLYFCLFSVLSLFISNKFKFNKFQRLIFISLLGTFFISTIIFKMKVYNFKNKKEKYSYPIKNFMGQMLTFYIIIYLLEPIFID